MLPGAHLLAVAIGRGTPLDTITDGKGDTLLALIAFFLVGLALVYFGAKQYRTGRLIKNTPTEKVRSIAIGRTEVNGTAREAGTVFDQPFSEGECLYRHWEVEEYKEDRSDDDNGKEWQTVASGTDAAPFFAEDDTGQVLVSAEDGATFEISGENTQRTVVGRGKSLPPRIQSFYENDDPEVGDDAAEQLEADADAGGGSMLGSVADAIGDAVSSAGRSRPSSRYKRRFTQKVLPVDEEVYVFGGAEQRAEASGSNTERLAIRTDRGTGRFIVSDRDESGLVKHYSRRGPALALLGLAVSAVTLYVLLNDFVVA